MNVIDEGSGPAVVLIPGIQGRWEWMRPAVDALARVCRVITFSLADEPTANGHFDAAHGFDSYVAQVREAMDARQLASATVCGVSYGGLIAAAFAVRYPERTRSVVLASALPPSWRADDRARFYLKAPRLLSPLFCIASLRLYPEIAAASGGMIAGLPPALRHAWNVITHMFSPSLMARRVRLLSEAHLDNRICDLPCPVLIVTGEPRLDRVVPVDATRLYRQLCPHAAFKVMPRTGHLGLITRPDLFAEIVGAFTRKTAEARPSRRHVG